MDAIIIKAAISMLRVGIPLPTVKMQRVEKMEGMEALGGLELFQVTNYQA
jgi:hypothetical protein